MRATLTLLCLLFPVQNLAYGQEQEPVPENPSEVTALDKVLFGLKTAIETGAVPQAISPIVAFAEDADTQAVAFLELWVNYRRKELEGTAEREAAGGKISRATMIGCQFADQLASRIEGVKRSRSRTNKKVEEDGKDPFTALYSTEARVLSGEMIFSLSQRPENSKSASVITPVWAGEDVRLVPVQKSQFTVALSGGSRRQVPVVLKSLDYELASYELGAGLSTGNNIAQHWTEFSPGRGSFDPKTGSFEFHFEVAQRNSLNAGKAPWLNFVHVFGTYSLAQQEALVFTQGKSLALAPESKKIANEPAAYAGTYLQFDHGKKLLTVTDHITGDRNCHLSCVRYADGSYALQKKDDPILGATVIVSPLKLTRTVSEGVWEFETATVSIRKGGRFWMQAQLEKPVLDSKAGEFGGKLAKPSFNEDENEPSTFLTELQTRKENLFLQLGSGPDVFDLTRLTDNFKSSGVMPFHSILNLEAGE